MNVSAVGRGEGCEGCIDVGAGLVSPEGVADLGSGEAFQTHPHPGRWRGR